MCGIFGIIGNNERLSYELKMLASFASRRGKDSSGFLYYDNDYKVKRVTISKK